MAQHTGDLLCYGIQTLSTTGLIGPPHWLLLVGLSLVSPREGTHPAPLGHSCLLCLGRVCRWHLWPFQERAEPQQGALLMQDQEHKATQCLRCCQIHKGLWEGQHHHEELRGPLEPDVPHWPFPLRGVRRCQTTESRCRWTQTQKPDTNPWRGHEETGVYGTCLTAWCLHWWVPHTLLLWDCHPMQDVHYGGAMSCWHCHCYDHLSWPCNIRTAHWLGVWRKWHHWHWGPL